MNMIKRLGHPRYKFVFEEREIKKMNNDFVMKILDFVEENEEFEGMICKVADNSYDKKIQVELSLNDIKTCIEITRITDEEIFDTLISEANGMKSRNSKKNVDEIDQLKPRLETMIEKANKSSNCKFKLDVCDFTTVCVTTDEDSFLVNRLLRNDEIIINDVAIFIIKEQERFNLENQNQFTLSDLKNGMVVENRNGDRYIVFDNIFYNNNCHYILKDAYNNKLECVNPVVKICDIMKVYDKINCVPKQLECLGKLLWQREEEPKKQPTENDIKIMSAFKLIDGYEYFCCDKSGYQVAFKEKPAKNDTYWFNDNYGCQVLSDRVKLSHITWEDKEPYHFVESEDE